MFPKTILDLVLDHFKQFGGSKSKIIVLGVMAISTSFKTYKNGNDFVGK